MARYTDIQRFDVRFWVGTEVSPNIISIAADWAYTYINSRLAKVYTTPFSVAPDAPDVIEKISDALTGAAAKALAKGDVLNRGTVESARISGEKDGKNLVAWNPFTWLQEIIDDEASVDGLTRKDEASAIIFEVQ